MNGASVTGGMFTVDRKFHTGMLDYARLIGAPLVTINPPSAGPIMDPVSVPLADLPYRVAIGDLNDIRDAQLVYGSGMGSAAMARSLSIPYIPIVEYDLATEITVSASKSTNPLRKALRTARCVRTWYQTTLPDFKGAHSIHCNGYPIHDVARQHNENTLLYLDSRMSQDMIMSPAALEARKRSGPLRLLYSGRYEQMKGAIDAVKVGLHCLALGIDIEMHCYGQGSLRDEMKRLATSGSDGRIVIHDAVPYPELVKISRGFDVFVCCHIQSDPSCTYLESFGAGLPIVGYANLMWQRLCEESGAGFASPIGRPRLVAEAVQLLSADPDLLASKSRLALGFAQAHSYEREHKKRIDAINQAIGIDSAGDHDQLPRQEDPAGQRHAAAVAVGARTA
jgi:glycosyltransferase involved in cell wall biosynthesis